MAHPAPPPFSTLPEALKRKIGLARLALGAERLMPPVTVIASVSALYVALAWFGLFSALPRWGHIALAALCALVLAYGLWLLIRWRLPAEAEGGHRLDLDDPARHRPLATLGDRPAGDDPVALALWQHHRDRAARAAAAIAVPPPVSPLPWRDRMALRWLPALLIVVAAFVAGDERGGRLADAFRFTGPRVAPVPPRLDVWIDPPAYTGRAPIFLSGANAPPAGPVHVPAGSVAVIRVSPGDQVTLVAPPGLKEKPQETKHGAAAPPAAPVAGAAFEKRLLIDQHAAIDVRRAGQSLGHYDLNIIPDLPPVVTLKDIETDDKARTLKLRYGLDDDYGVAKAEAIITRGDGSSSRVLLPAPEAPISGRSGENETTLALAEHPWAGAKVTIRLKVSDDIGQSAESAARDAVIPARRFESPISRSLAEQRRQIVMFPDNRRTPQIALDSLLVAPERFTRKSGDFLMLSIAARKMRTVRHDADLIALAQYLWETAIAFDDGDLTEAERRLRAAEERLREALERGANPDEIRRLMDEMRQAMNEMLRELMEKAERNADNQQRGDDRNTMSLSRRDLEDMLKRIEELYRSGDSAKAQELLRQLQELLKNMQSARRRNADPRMKEMGEALDELDRMRREQEGLRDETFRNQQQRRQMGRNGQNRERGQQGQRGQRGQQGQQGQQGEGEEDGDEGEDGADGGEQGLAERQQALRDRLNRLRERLRQQGAPTEEGFDGADEGMGDAEQNLRQRQGGRATQGQQQAIDELGKAGRGLAQQMQREMGEGGEPGEGEGFGPGNPDGNPRGRAQQNTDPLGRPLPGDRNQMDNSRVKIPQGGDVKGTIGERAQRVLEELRRRFGEIERPREELDYIERLLRRN